MTEQKTALVTGSGKGIGRECGLYLARSGYHVIGCSRTLLDLDTLAAEIGSLGGKFTGFPVDVRNFDSLAAFGDQLRQGHHHLDVLVVNAGVDLENATVEDSAVESWEDVIAINLVGAYKTVKAFLPLLKTSGAGKIILIGSGLGHRGLPQKSAYSVSKAGQWMLTRILAQELMEYGIVVNEIIPGPVRTSIGRNLAPTNAPTSQVFSAEWNKDPRDLIPLFAFLLSQGPHGPTGQTFSLARRDLF